MLYEALKDARPVYSIHGYRDIETRRRHYEKLSHQPHNFLVTGDAPCALNPVYGQGMSVSAMVAEALEECLGGSRTGYTSGLSRRFQSRLAKKNAGPWMLATGKDLRVRETEGVQATLHPLDQPLLWTGSWISRSDLVVRRTFLEVFGRLKTPTVLFGPTVSLRLLRAGKNNGKRAEGQPRSTLRSPRFIETLGPGVRSGWSPVAA